MIIPAIEIGSPKTDTPKGTHQSIKTRNIPKMAMIVPEVMRPLYMHICETLIDAGYVLFRNGKRQHTDKCFNMPVAGHAKTDWGGFRL